MASFVDGPTAYIGLSIQQSFKRPFHSDWESKVSTALFKLSTHLGLVKIKPGIIHSRIIIILEISSDLRMLVRKSAKEY